MHAPISFNTLWPRHAIWRHRSGPTLAQVMACCLMAPSHYLTQCWLIINEASDHQLKAISQEIPQPSITKVSLKITYITFHANLPGANELNHVSKWGPRSEWISGFIHRLREVSRTSAIRHSPFNGKCQKFDIRCVKLSCHSNSVVHFLKGEGSWWIFLGGQRYFVRNGSNSRWNA